MNAALNHDFTVSSLRPGLGLTAGAILMAEETAADLPHLIRSHKYGDALMTEEQFRAKEEIPKLMRAIQDASPCGSTAYQLNNRIRIRHSITHHDDVPPDEAEECVIFLRELLAEAKSRNFQRFGGEDGELEFAKTVIGGNEPSTSWISRKLGYKPTGRPNWRELAKQVGLASEARQPAKRTLQERAPAASVSSMPVEPERSQQSGGSVAENDVEPWHAPWPQEGWKEERPDMPEIIRERLALVESAAVGLCEIARILSYDEERRGYAATLGRDYTYKSPVNRHDLMAAQAVIAQVLQENLETMRTHCDWTSVRGDIRFT